MDVPAVRRLIELAVDEDLGAGDLTAALLPEPARQVNAAVAARTAGVVCGLAVAPLICESFSRRLGAELVFAPSSRDGRVISDGDRVCQGDRVADVRGPHAAVLTLERTLLNFVCRMSGVATRTRAFVEAAAAANPTVRVFDTRKTIPGWRKLDKYAVRAGGGHNHRFGLFDAVLIKDNHLAGVAVHALRRHVTELIARVPRQPGFVEVEVDTLEQFAEVCRVDGVDLILLDNFTEADLARAVGLRDKLGLRDRVELEASGGVTLETVARIAATGIDRVAVGSLTHSAAGLDFGLDF